MSGRSRIGKGEGAFSAVSYCRVCQASCGVVIDIEDGRILNVRGDPENPLSRGYICSKGREAAAVYHGENRLRAAMRRGRDGGFEPVKTEDALDAIAKRLARICEESGPDSIALFTGTYALFGALTVPFARAWLRGLGSTALYTTGTIDQSAKWIVPFRMGRWEGGWQNFEDADVWLLSGTNPLVSMQGGGTLTGFPAYDPVARLREAKARGLKLIVIDPRATETARQADIHLQPVAGEDAAIFAGILNIVFDEHLYDADFCERYVGDLDALRSAVASFSPDMVTQRAGLDIDDLVEAARIFARSKRGMAHSGTGPDMGPHSNLTAHLIAALNVVCGRYARAGDRVGNPGVLTRRGVRREAVTPPVRHWEDENIRPIHGYGTLWGERPTNVLPETMLSKGADRVRALITVGANPIACWPDQSRTREALSALDFHVVLDPRLTETARYADYVIAPTLPYERPDHTQWYEALFPVPYAQYTQALIQPPSGVIEDWRFFHELARRMGTPMTIGNSAIDTAAAPDADVLLRLIASNGEVPYDDVVNSPHGRIFDVARTVEAGGDASAKFQLLPDDVAGELAALRAAPDEPEGYPLRLTCRRARWMMNSYDASWPSVRRHQQAPTAWMNPGDIMASGIQDGEWARIESSRGSLDAVIHADASLRPGVVSMPHCQENGSTARLVDANPREAINAMPRMSAIPVRLTPLASAGDES